MKMTLLNFVILIVVLFLWWASFNAANWIAGRLGVYITFGLWIVGGILIVVYKKDE